MTVDAHGNPAFGQEQRIALKVLDVFIARFGHGAYDMWNGSPGPGVTLCMNIRYCLRVYTTFQPAFWRRRFQINQFDTEPFIHPAAESQCHQHRPSRLHYQSRLMHLLHSLRKFPIDLRSLCSRSAVSRERIRRFGAHVPEFVSPGLAH